ncbi:helix-turn-helix domain-containing protein [Nannocystis bainbridge]|uniref:Helix-turn-helix transcriptional regulator n=1 Tax=Nannocystis bainbridge TaxID=2995303 RepID=A0ABT5EEG4_9BACT|nr:helix-turn-helix transcriptional regulator [Nannocystis bainbridge]MDC0723212.1 helix-turn-helix transcriptional regulator [Nannocystis bainbridge]
MLALFDEPDPNPSLRLYLDLVQAAGAQLIGVRDNTPRAVIERLASITRENEITMSALARASNVNRPQLSTLFNDPEPNPKLAIIDRIVVALEAERDLGLMGAAPDANEVESDEDDDDDSQENEDGDADDDGQENEDGDEDDRDEDGQDDEDDEGDGAGGDDDQDDEDDGYADDDGQDDEDDGGGDDDGRGDEDDGDADDDAQDDEDDSDADGQDDEDDDEDEDGGEDELDESRGGGFEISVQVLSEQNLALQRQALIDEVEIRALKKRSRWNAFKVVAGAVLGAGVAAAVLKRRKE